MQTSSDTQLEPAVVEPIRFTLETKNGPVDFTIEGDTVTANWWTPEVRAIMCDICPRKGNCDPNCLTKNPWCG